MTEQCTEIMRMMGGTMMGGMMEGSMMGGMMWPMMLGMLLFWTLVIVGTVLLVRLVWTRSGNGKSTAAGILQERYARGEIDLEEYQERRSALQSR